MNSDDMMDTVCEHCDTNAGTGYDNQGEWSCDECRELLNEND